MTMTMTIEAELLVHRQTVVNMKHIRGVVRTNILDAWHHDYNNVKGLIYIALIFKVVKLIKYRLVMILV